MTKSGGKRHLKRPAMPKTWPVPRKGSKFIIRMNPGPHRKEYAMPLLILLRDVLKVAENRREAKYILSNRKVLVDGKERTSEKFPVGHMDVVYLKGLEKYYRIQNHISGRLMPFEISEEEANVKICKVTGKKTIRGGKTQISLHDGRNIVLESEDERVEQIKRGSTLKIEVPSQEIKEIYPLEENVYAMVTEGHHQGKMGQIVSINKRFGPKASEVTFSSDNGDFSTALEYVFVVGKDEPAITLLR